eukprot:CAMPEP_0119040328 /NCGR_PEP_ID=MMETSP1177-20130426/10219_1 /TAXON_ID=2985 /ORGANISM="Ochromonas sp, Strain CCMP1899" /LENGTH=263 /DNA_ID=CAMNT_0007005269 /DNA_START=85 /DNA_END=873 /DNA_ORIENTATION=+
MNHTSMWRGGILLGAVDGNIAEVTSCLKNGIDIETNENGWTALMAAAEEGHEPVVALLLAKGADVNAVDDEYNGAIDYAATESIKAMLQNHMEQVDRITVLLEEAEEGNIYEVTSYLRNGLDIESKDKWGKTVLMAAASGGHEPDVALLLAMGAEVDATDKRGYTALRKAVEEGHDLVVATLLAKGADVNAADEDGITALIIAVKNRDEPVVATLLAKRADVNAVDSLGNTAIDYAKRDSMKILLQEHIEQKSPAAAKTPLAK